MDPNATLVDLRDAVRAVAQCDGSDPNHLHDAATDLMEAADALDRWISRGGFLPADWAKAANQAGMESMARNIDTAVRQARLR